VVLEKTDDGSLNAEGLDILVVLVVVRAVFNVSIGIWTVGVIGPDVSYLKMMIEKVQTTINRLIALYRR
jgi:hypothetical protein